MKKSIFILFLLLIFISGAKAQTCFTKNWSGNGYEQMNIYVTKATINNLNLQPGDEIGVFDGNECVGVSKLSEEITENNILGIVTSKDDNENDSEINGFIPGHTIIFKFCVENGSRIIENVVANYLTGDGTFHSNESAVVELSFTNNPPYVANPITDQILAVGFSSFSLDISNVFNDADEDILTYTVTSSNEGVVTAFLSGTTLMLTETGTGTSDITVTADDGKGYSPLRSTGRRTGSLPGPGDSRRHEVQGFLHVRSGGGKGRDHT